MSAATVDPGPALLEARGISRWYGEHRALYDLDLALHRGEVVGLLGPNGAGKSTTMQILAGVLAPHAGSVHVDGIDLLEQPRAAKARIGYLPEHPPLTRELTVDEQLDFCARLHRVPRRELAAARERAKLRCGLVGTGRQLIAHLSKGYRQRVGIAQAIVHQPPVVILDEPTSGLDPIQIREIRALIRALGRDHSVILSTHILAEVQAVCDRVVIVHEGRVVLDAGTGELAPGQGAELRVTLRRPPSESELRALPGVLAVEALDRHRFVVRHDGDADFAERLAARAVARAWGLAELTPAAGTLEDTFMRLTRGEEARP